MEVICVVTGREGLNADAVALLAEALERAGALAALASGGPALRGAAPAEAGRHVGLCVKPAASDLALLYVPEVGGALALRRWFAATQALLDASLAATRAAPPLAAGSHGSLAALAALLEAGAPSAWCTPGGADPGGQGRGRPSRINIICTTPTTHIDEDLLSGALLDADGAGHLLVKFILVKQPIAQPAQRSIQDELACERACSAFIDTVAMSDNGTSVMVDANGAAFERLAMGLLLPERTPAGVPQLLTTLNFPAPLHAGGPRSVRLSLRPGVLPLHDTMAPVKVCRCHGKGVLCKDAAIGADDVAHFLALADKNNVCSVSAKRLQEHEWIPNAVSVGRDNYICLPSFFQVGRRTSDVAFTAHCTVALSGVTEAHLFGCPWSATAISDEDEDAAAGDADDAILAAALGGAPGGSADKTPAEANGLHVGALVIALARSDLGLVLSCETNLDTGKPTPFRCFYLAQAPHQTADQGAAIPSLLLRRIAAREELLPAQSAAASTVTIGDVPAPLETEVAASLAASLPLISTYDPLQNERGIHKVVKSLVAKSLAPPAPVPPSSRKKGHESGQAKQPSGKRAKAW